MVDVDGMVWYIGRRQTPHLPAGHVWFLRQDSLAQAVVLYAGDRTGQLHVSRLEYSSLTTALVEGEEREWSARLVWPRLQRGVSLLILSTLAVVKCSRL
jgi:hypothetical protein